MHEKLDAKKKVMEDMSMRSKLAKEDANKQEDQLSVQVRSLLVAGTALSVARKRLQVYMLFYFFYKKVELLYWNKTLYVSDDEHKGSRKITQGS